MKPCLKGGSGVGGQAVGDMYQPLRAVSTLADDPSLILSTHMVVYNYPITLVLADPGMHTQAKHS